MNNKNNEYDNKKSFELESIRNILNILEQTYATTTRTTLNRMRDEKDPFKILIACLISLRAKDQTTEKISNELFKIANTPQEILKIPQKELEKILFSTGHYKKKSMILRSVSSELIDRFNSIVPDNDKDLQSIKFIGPKTANIVLNFAFDKEVIPVDTNVHRIFNRIGIINTKTPNESTIKLEKTIPKNFWKDINAISMLHGKNICFPISPHCSICPIEKYCNKINIKNSR